MPWIEPEGTENMPVELRILALSTIVLLFYIIAATQSKTAQYGAKWNMGPRDDALPAANPLSGRLARAQANFLETYPIAIIALLGVVVAGKTSASTALGGWIWLGARVVYWPLYAAGIPLVRTLAWGVSIVGLAMVIWPLLAG
jgi:uncharacterized MAPEG superfamily protein